MRDPLYEAFLAEQVAPGPFYVGVSNHFSHSDACTARGCVLMGPTEDRAACEDWAKSYNRLDPYDYARCVEAGDYLVPGADPADG